MGIISLKKTLGHTKIIQEKDKNKKKYIFFPFFQTKNPTQKSKYEHHYS